MSDFRKNVIWFALIFLFFIILIIVYSKFKVFPYEKTIIKEIVAEDKIITDLNIGVLEENEIEDIDLYKSESRVLNNVFSMISNSLFEYDSNNVLKPKLIENYTNINNEIYIFKIKEGIFFSDGQALIANDIKNTLERIYVSKNSIYKKYVNNIKNVKIIDNSTFRINLITPEKEFEKNLIFPIVNIKNCGTGDYIIKELTPKKIVLENYKGLLDQKITIYIYNNLEELLIDFLNKKSDLIKVSESMEYKKYLGEFGYNKKKYNIDGVKNILIYNSNLIGIMEPDELFDFKGINTWKKKL